MANETILVVEDNADLLRNNCDFLTQIGYTTLGAETLEAARRAVQTGAVDLVLLDINLPDGTGFELADALAPHIAILYLTGRTGEEDVVRGLSRGVGRVDYLRKPFSYAEMGARVKALLGAEQRQMVPRIMHGPLALDMLAGHAYIAGRELPLTQKEFALLLLLLQNEGGAISKEALYGGVWKQPLAGDGSALWMQLSRLKKKLEEASGGQITIHSSRREGYWLGFGPQEVP